jgi:hypothetical protein
MRPLLILGKRKPQIFFIPRPDTASFQALEFYLKNSYQILAKLPMLIKGRLGEYDYYMIKYLRGKKNKKPL